jgi:heat shock protein HtpX
MIFCLILAGVMNFAAYWFSDKIALAGYGAREVSPQEAPQLHRMISNVAQRANLPMPKVYIIPSDTPNAFATGRNPQNAAVAVTEGILRLLNEDELEGVIGHELAHINNRDILISSIVATIAGAITYLAHMAQFAAFFGGFRGDDESEGIAGFLPMLVMAILAPIAACLIQMAISRSREYQADATGARFCGNPLSLANALIKLERGVMSNPMNTNPSKAHMFIVNPLRGGGLISLFSTHPPIPERVRRLKEMAGVR